MRRLLAWGQHHPIQAVVTGWLALLAILAALVAVVTAFDPALAPERTWSIGMPVTAVAFSPDGQVVAGGEAGGTVRLWRLADGRLLEIIGADGPGVTSIAFGPDGLFLAVGYADQTIRLWEVPRTRLVHTWRLPPGPVFRSYRDTPFVSPDLLNYVLVSFSPDGRVVAATGDANIIRLWQVQDGGQVAEFDQNELEQKPAHIRSQGIGFSPDGHLLVSIQSNLGTEIWQLPHGGVHERRDAPRQQVRFHHFVQEAAVGPGGLMVAAVMNSGTEVFVWRPLDATAVQTLHGHGTPVRSLAFSHGGQMLASGGTVHPERTVNNWLSKLLLPDDLTIRLWDLGTGAQRVRLVGHTANVRSLAFSPDDRWVASGSDDGTVKLWHVPD